MVSKYKIAIIIPYFGKFPNYFNLFLKSCENNSSIDFLIFTDDTSRYDFPMNVKVKYMKFSEFKNIIKSKFNFDLKLDNPYKLCDFKPAYGFIFDSYLTKYDFWGYCDVDLIFGNIRKFIDDNILEKYNKIFQRGHLSLVRNEEKYNKLFMKEYRGKVLYKEIFQSSENKIFDEKFHSNGGGINGIFNDNKCKVYENDKIIADINIRFNNFKVNSDNSKKTIDSIFVYKNKCVWRKIVVGNIIEEQEYIYIHLQKRDMNLDTALSFNKNEFTIIPNKFLSNEINFITCKDIKKFNKRKLFYSKYILIRYKNFKKKVKNIIIK